MRPDIIRMLDTYDIKFDRTASTEDLLDVLLSLHTDRTYLPISRQVSFGSLLTRYRNY